MSEPFAPWVRPAVAALELVDGLPMVRSRPVGLTNHRLVVPVRVADLCGALGQQISPLRERSTGSIRPTVVLVESVSERSCWAAANSAADPGTTSDYSATILGHPRTGHAAEGGRHPHVANG